MMLGATELLGALASGIRPGGSRRPSQGGAAEGGFATALERAKAGELPSHAPVQVAKGLDIKLNDEQLSRLSMAADKAEAQGAGRALVLMDGKAMTLDVATRTITGTADVNSAQVLSNVDTVITVPPQDAPTPSTPLGPPSAGAAALANPSLLKSLSTPRGLVEQAAGGLR